MTTGIAIANITIVVATIARVVASVDAATNTAIGVDATGAANKEG